MKKLIRVPLFVLVMLAVAALPSSAQNDDCHTFTDEITVTAELTPTEIEQIPITLHNYHDASRKCTNWYSFSVNDVPYQGTSVPASCLAGNRRSGAQGQLVCNSTSGPGGSPGCQIDVRLRCDGINHSVTMVCPDNWDGSMPWATFDYTPLDFSGPDYGIGCIYQPTADVNSRVAKKMYCSGSDLIVNNCYDNYLYCNTYVQQPNP